MNRDAVDDDDTEAAAEDGSAIMADAQGNTGKDEGGKETKRSEVPEESVASESDLALSTQKDERDGESKK